MELDQTTEKYRSLSYAERIDELVDIQKRRAALDAEEQRLLAVIDADPTDDPERRDVALAKGFVGDEVACALRIANGTAQSRLHVARTLVDQFPATLESLTDGGITYWHCRRLVEGTRNLGADLAWMVEDQVLPRAGSQTVAEFARAVCKAVLLLDPADQTDRHLRAAKDRRVEAFPGQDGVTTIWALLPAADAEGVMTCLDALAGRADPDDERTMDQRRVDALTDLALDALDRVCPARHGRKPAVQVTVALSTLLGIDEQPGDLAGYGPIPAELARELAFDTTGTWRRLVTDECGRLVDLGTTAYRPPQSLQDFVITRDQTCRTPGCERKPCTCDLDHVRPWPSGTTEAANLHPLCSRHHHLKHQAGWQVIREPDGTTTWFSPTGHRYEKPPCTYPIDHTTDPRPPTSRCIDH